MVGSTTLGFGISASGNSTVPAGPSPPLFAGLSSGDLTTPGTVFTTTAATPGANRLALLALNVFSATPAIATPTSVTGNGMTWVLVRKSDYQVTGGEHESLMVYRALSATTALGALTITTAGETWQEVAYSLSHCVNVDQTGTNGSGAIVQSAAGHTGDNGTSESVTIAASVAANAVFAVIGQTATGAITPTGSGSPIEIHDLSTAGLGLETQWLTGTSVTSMSGSWASASARGSIAIEVKNA